MNSYDTYGAWDTTDLKEQMERVMYQISALNQVMENQRSELDALRGERRLIECALFERND